MHLHTQTRVLDSLLARGVFFGFFEGFVFLETAILNTDGIGTGTTTGQWQAEASSEQEKRSRFTQCGDIHLFVEMELEVREKWRIEVRRHNRVIAAVKLNLQNPRSRSASDTCRLARHQF